MWRWQEVAAWFAEALGEPQATDDPSNARFITAFNAGLSWRQVEDQLPDAERQRIRQLVG